MQRKKSTTSNPLSSSTFSPKSPLPSLAICLSQLSPGLIYTFITKISHTPLELQLLSSSSVYLSAKKNQPPITPLLHYLTFSSSATVTSTFNAAPCLPIQAALSPYFGQNYPGSTSQRLH